MCEYALEVQNLTKNFGSFALRNVSFKLPVGYIMGFVGRNGAGKSTTIKSIMRIITPDGGSIKVFGEDMAENEVKLKKTIAYSSGTFDSFPSVEADKLAKTYATFYDDFDFGRYEELKKRFDLDGRKKLKSLSAGMRVKFSVALALSHEAKLFIFDEPTSGLDPVARDEMLDLFQEIVSDGDKSVLFSTHITSDLDKCADYLTIIDGGKIYVSGVKDEIISSHAVIGGGDLTDEIKRVAIGYKQTSLGFTALVKKSDLPKDGIEYSAPPDIEQMLLYVSKGSREKGGYKNENGN